MKKMTQKHLRRTIILAGIAVIIGAFYGMMEARKEISTQGVQKTHKVAGISLGGDFALTDQDGNAVTQDNYAGKYKLIFFGFTHCPMICPTELQKLAQVHHTLQDTQPHVAKKIQMIFITTDPQRDTPEVIKEYLGLFHAPIVGLTGSEEEIKTVIDSYRVYAQRVESEDSSEYEMDHSAYTYLMDPDNELVSIYRMKDTATYLTHDLTQKLR